MVTGYDTTPTPQERELAREHLERDNTWSSPDLVRQVRVARLLGCLGATIGAMTEAPTPDDPRLIARARAMYEALEETER